MKNLDDEKIVRAVRENSSYQIKTTSDQILQKFEARKRQKEEKKHFHWQIPVAAGCTLALACSLVGVFVFTKRDQPFPDALSDTNLENQFKAFSFLLGGQNDAQLRSRRMKSSSFRNVLNDIDQTYFEELCDVYDDYNMVMKNVYSETRSERRKYELEIDGTYYHYTEKLYLKDSTSAFAELYFNDEKIFDTAVDENEKTYRAIYIAENQKFDLTVNKSIESDEEEQEIEFSLIFESREGNTCYSVEKEQEIEGAETESAYTLMTYLTREDLLQDNFSEKITYEYETEGASQEIELSVEKNQKEYNFENILQRENKTTFTGCKEEGGEEFVPMDITLDYTDSGRFYTSGNLTYKK